MGSFFVQYDVESDQLWDSVSRQQNVLAMEVVPFRLSIVLDKQFITDTNINSLIIWMDAPTWIFIWLTILVLTFAYKFIPELKTLLYQGFNIKLVSIPFTVVIGLWHQLPPAMSCQPLRSRSNV